jgi:hypothetical protein
VGFRLTKRGCAPDAPERPMAACWSLGISPEEVTGYAA